MDGNPYNLPNIGANVDSKPFWESDQFGAMVDALQRARENYEPAFHLLNGERTVFPINEALDFHLQFPTRSPDWYMGLEYRF